MPIVAAQMKRRVLGEAAFVYKPIAKKKRTEKANGLLPKGWGRPADSFPLEIYNLWTTHVKLDDTRLRQLLPNLHKTSYAEGIRATIGVIRPNGVSVET